MIKDTHFSDIDVSQLKAFAKKLRYSDSNHPFHENYKLWRIVESCSINVLKRDMKKNFFSLILDCSLPNQWPQLQIQEMLKSKSDNYLIMMYDVSEAAIGIYEPFSTIGQLEEMFPSSFANGYKTKIHPNVHRQPKTFIFGTLYFRNHLVLCYCDRKNKKMLIINSNPFPLDFRANHRFHELVWEKLSCILFDVQNFDFFFKYLGVQYYNDCSIWTCIIILVIYQNCFNRFSFENVLKACNKHFRHSEQLFCDFIQKYF